ncbi:hypothetical protein EG349_19180 [Chryseobacterium shandongense]|uniref:Lipoprotein n=1 Tax=Chryseobacterium shandongense TaxID=1493872 RepID=A0AAD1DPI1_9FLAO|nr:hypothetical protein [Chryseobacterium shandongense]AZA88744.1 hypothetical protein EG349_19180 [Chryseobacterium shandongense]AZA97286.1 hypothetical protein EG353_17895 [Chryseobacterium shandongense]
MKKYLIIFFVIPLLISCKKDIIATFEIHIENLDRYDESEHELYKLEIYRNNRIYKVLKSEFPYNLDRTIRIDSIKDGKYLFVYENIFGKQVKNEILVDASKNYKIRINPDRLDDKFKSSAFENMRNDEVKLIYKSSGCFHLQKDSITILNRGDYYFIKYDNGKLKKIDKKIIENFVDLENRIRNIPKERGCTTVDSFIFKFKSKSDTFYDGTCRINLVSTLTNYRKKIKL